MIKDFTIPPVGTQGVFTFKPPYNAPEADGKEYEVVEIRKIKSLHDSGEKPYENIYATVGLSTEDFAKDLSADVPIVTLMDSTDSYYYVPANRIQEIPTISGYTATERLLTFSLGVVPDDIDLSPLIENIRTMIHDTLSISPEAIEVPGSDTVLMSVEDHDKYVAMMMKQSRSLNKSWRLLYLEEVEANKEIRKEKEIINKTMVDLIGESL